jgi:hypothetical protein
MKYLISEEEKSRILEMHQNATSRQYLSEQATPAKPTATPSMPSVMPIYGAAGTSTISFSYDRNNDQIKIYGTAKQSDGSLRTLKPYSDSSENISRMASIFMSYNGFKQPQLKRTLESKLTELKGKIDTYKKTKPNQ